MEFYGLPPIGQKQRRPMDGAQFHPSWVDEAGGELERFSNWYSLTHFIEGDFFLRKKPLSLLASVYSYWRTALKKNKRGSGDPRYSRPGGRRYSFISRGAVKPVRDCYKAIRFSY
jgi:hypothetical protein